MSQWVNIWPRLELSASKFSFYMKQVQQGLTLIELLVGMAVVVITLTVGVPSFQDFLKDSRLTTQVNEMVSSFNYARMEAVQRSRVVRVSAANNNWANGWTVWVDLDADGQLDTNENLLTMQALDTGMTLTPQGGATELLYSGEGMITGGVGETFQLCDDRTGEEGRAILVQASGAVRLSNIECS